MRIYRIDFCSVILYMEKQKLFNKYERRLNTFATDVDIKVALNCGDDKIIKYSELDKYDCFDTLLPNKEFDFKLILIEQQENVGHWVAVARKGENIYLFDSYGNPIDKELSFIDTATKMLLGEDKQMINRLIKKCNCDLGIHENCYQVQSEKKGVSTCGRHCILFIELVKMGYNLDEYLKFFYTSSENTGKPTDILVVDWVPIQSDFERPK